MLQYSAYNTNTHLKVLICWVQSDGKVVHYQTSIELELLLELSLVNVWRMYINM